ncbi:hypothetical protein [Roseitranquillus sediminis]|uniref:hypothetical protein n=1 Tax=Roseitranquillus sediminis TaxID=2809051 RepID=UPI001D0C1D39|nr:hypothetical protein [Roseitranquillus sediminis]MBM9595362.1 hypothetical protein [Roseitranquillus sediminis]
MSAPKTNVEKQKEQHKAPLLGMRAVVMWSVGLLILLLLYVFFTGNEPEGADVQVDGRTGAVEETDEPAVAEPMGDVVGDPTEGPAAEN